MIYVRLLGGLGNQMFQYAVGRRLAERRNTELTLDTSQLGTPDPSGATTRFYELGCFHIRATLTGTPAAIYHPTTYLARARRRLGLRHRRRLITESHLGFDRGVLDAPDGTVLNGYWQDARYFEDIAPIIRDELRFRGAPSEATRAVARQIAGTEAVSLHVRRGDYISNPDTNRFHGTCNVEYYRLAMAHMASVLRQPHFYAFSDDPDWTREHLASEHPLRIVDHNPPDRGHEDMRLMTACRHHIIANSSFSWWGAWLNASPDKIVVAPRRWYRDEAADAVHELPDAWLRL